ncbi:MAG: hypothetical protein DRH93_00455 [Deltaproteobacteria bacterium]|nr:MAG: hypothetical protein DRH93_00455 [Deltaproteobacteria bacterium]
MTENTDKKDLTHPLEFLEKKQILDKLKKSEERYQNLIENLDTGITRSTPGPDGRYIEVNPYMVSLLGYSKEDLFKSNIFKFHTNTGQADAIYAEIKNKGSIQDKEISLKHKNGSPIVISYTGRAVKDTNGKILYIDDILVDITLKKTSEEEIQKNEKLESIGALAGGIAHNFNNIMTSLFGNISLAKMKIPRNHAAVQHLEKSEESMQDGIKLTRQLLTFAKGGDPIKENINIAAFIKDAAMFNLSGSSIKLNFSSQKDLWQIGADRSQISQVISNIVMNARQSMPAGGQIDIRLTNSDLLKDNLLTISKSNYIKITITDKGSGIRKKNLEKIFDPYFTTRENGSGMGLSICYSIIKKHGGYLSVSSQVGTGTTLTIYLPAISTQTLKDKTLKTI